MEGLNATVATAGVTSAMGMSANTSEFGINMQLQTPLISIL